MGPILQSTNKGLYCSPGGFYVDPHRPVDRAVVTHAHTDHARWGCRQYLAAQPSEHLLRMRMKPDAEFEFLPYGECVDVGGVRISEPAADLAVLLAVVSSLTDRPLAKKMVVFGEVGLAGEVRPAPRGQERLREAAKLGFTQAIIPTANQPRQPIDGIEIIAVDRLAEAVARLRG